MKKIFTLATFSVISWAATSQRLFVEDFNYNTGNLTPLLGGNVGLGNWSNVTGTAVPITVVAGNLNYEGYFTNPTASSNKIIIVNTPGSAEDIARIIPTTPSTGTVYCSMLFKLTSGDASNLFTNSSTTGEYFTSFSPSSATTNFVSRIYIRQGSVPNTVNFGVSAISNVNAVFTPTAWIATDYTASSMHLITFAYQFVAGNLNDVCKLWVDQPFSNVEPLPMAVSLNTGSDPANVGNVIIRQNGAFSPNADLDAISVATTYEASLPLTLTSFNGAFNGKATLLKWTTENEVNVAGFSVEKSLDGTNFSEFEYVAAKNSNLQNVYTLNDSKVKGGVSYYRLKQLDKNGTFKYSSIVVVKNKSAIKAEVFPNPTKGNLTVSHGEAEAGASIKIMSLDGKQIKSLKLQSGSTQTGLSVSDLVKGNYIVVFENNGSKSVTQFTKQ